MSGPIPKRVGSPSDVGMREWFKRLFGSRKTERA